MKRTTYIILGMLLAGLVAVCGCIFYASALIISEDDSVMEIGGERKSVSLPDCKVIQFVSDRRIVCDNGNMKRIAFAFFPLRVIPTDSLTGSLSCLSGLERYLSLDSVGDTLRISLRFDKGELEREYCGIESVNVRSEEMVLYLPANVQQVTSCLKFQPVTFKDLERDSLAFSTDAYTEVENCRFKALSAQSGNLRFNSGEALHLHLNLDEIDNWIVESDAFHVDTEYLYASNEQKCILEKGECREVIWMPQSEKALLNIRLDRAAKIVVTE